VGASAEIRQFVGLNESDMMIADVALLTPVELLCRSCAMSRQVPHALKAITGGHTLCRNVP
jgi:hypothetical protein